MVGWNFRMFLFSATVFVSAFLLFLVQPLIARIILPWFGGTASVWTTCLMFFQFTLLAGYLYAHGAVRFLSPVKQAWVHITLLALSLAMLPILPGSQWKPLTGDLPVLRILAVLAASVGIPYLVLSTTGPLVQTWFARAHPGASPYRLYSLSNAGSLLALVSYPLVVEPTLHIGAQGYVWSAVYALFVLICGALTLRARRAPAANPDGERTPSSAPNLQVRLLWVALAFCPSALLAAFTSHVTQNIAPIPLLWILPLSVYLLSFILTFDSERWYSRRFWFPAFIAFAALLLGFLFPAARNASVLILVPVFVTGLFVCAMVCHGELYRLRPDPAYLTTFYLMISAGGALGGFFVAVIAPLVFRSYVEAPIALLGCVILMAVVLRRDKPSMPGPSARLIEWGLLAAVAGGFVYLLAYEVPHWMSRNRLVARNFYGVLRVTDVDGDDEDPPVRELYHGSITHGSEFMNAAQQRQPTTYYGPRSGVGLAIANAHANPGRRIGVVGLGAGTIAAYAKPGDVIRFYEINPLVTRIAREQFHFLDTAPAPVTIVPGDARLSLEREPPQNYDVLAVDAFSGDSIPVHLITIEAFREYLRHMKADGVVAVHVSNKYVELSRVAGTVARALAKPAIRIEDSGDDAGTNHSDWILVGNRGGAFDDPKWSVHGRSEISGSGLRLWTDDYSNLVAILKLPHDMNVF
jgi:spermidine synthase